jgi:hypothetical protein
MTACAATLAALFSFNGISPVFAASAPRERRQEIEVSIDTSTLEPASGERLEHALDDEVTALLREQGLEVVRRSAEGRLEARIEMVDAERREYAISLELVLEGRRETLINALACTACSEATVIKQTLALVPAAIRRIEAQQPAPAAESGPSAPPGRRLGALGIAGIATLSGGMGSVIAGSILVEQSPTVETSRQVGQAQGAALVSVGVTAVLLGVTALAVDLTVLDRRRRERRLDVSIDATPTSAGLWLSGRF